MKITRIRAIASWPACKNWAISLRICLSCNSLLFWSNFIREIANVKHVLLQNQLPTIIITYGFKPTNKNSMQFTSYNSIAKFRSIENIKMITIHNYTEESIKIKTFSLKKKNFGRKKNPKTINKDLKVVNTLIWKILMKAYHFAPKTPLLKSWFKSDIEA